MSYYPVCHHKVHALSLRLAENMSPKFQDVLRIVDVPVAMIAVHTWSSATNMKTSYSLALKQLHLLKQLP